jgi:hypothetical protein
MRFFVPGFPDEEAGAALEKMREASGAPKDTRPLRSITYELGGAEIVATVGEETLERRWQLGSRGERDESRPPAETHIGNVVVAIIFAGDTFCIFEEEDSAWVNPRWAPLESVVEMAFFDEE